MKKFIVILFHLLFCLFIVGLGVFTTFIHATQIAIPDFVFKGDFSVLIAPNIFQWIDSLGFGLSVLLMIYVAYFIYLPKYLIEADHKGFAYRLLGMLVGFTFFVYASIFILHQLFDHKFLSFRYPENFEQLIFGFSIQIGIGTALRMFFQWFDDVQDKTILEKQKIKSELDLLKSRLNPAFLFGTIKNIDALIPVSSLKASTALNKLSELMRYVVYESRHESVSLQDEVNYLQNYIELLQLNQAEENDVQLNLKGDINDQRISPMLIIPFVEQVINHENKGQVDIRFSVSETSIDLSCRKKTYQALQNKKGGQDFLLLVKKLQMAYGNNFNLKVIEKEKEYGVDLTLKSIC